MKNPPNSVVEEKLIFEFTYQVQHKMVEDV